MFDGKAVYQLFCGRLETANVVDHKSHVFERMVSLPWEKLYDSGFQFVYLLGVFDSRGPLIVTEERGVQLEDVPHRLASPFAISNHTGFHPNLGQSDDFARLLEAIQSNGLKVMVDFVPNHTGTTHAWVQEHPEYYKREGRDLETSFSGDVYVLNYDNDKLRSKMMAVLDFIGSMGVDGVRCDMAHLIPTDFWEETISATKAAYDGFGILAEAYGDSVFDWSPLTRLLEAGFDGVYHEFLYRNLKQDLAHSGSGLTHVIPHLKHFIEREDNDQFIHFLSNHDDPLLETFELLQPALMTILCCLSGGVLIYNGQLHGVTKRIGHHYYDQIAMDLSEFMHLPEWFIDLRDIVLVYSPKLTKVSNLNGMLVGDLIFKERPGVLVANLTDASVSINISNNVDGKGLLKGLKLGDVLPSGQAELFFTR